jgi:hypothetical protein
MGDPLREATARLPSRVCAAPTSAAERETLQALPHNVSSQNPSRKRKSQGTKTGQPERTLRAEVQPPLRGTTGPAATPCHGCAAATVETSVAGRPRGWAVAARRGGAGSASGLSAGGDLRRPRGGGAAVTDESDLDHRGNSDHDGCNGDECRQR